MRRNASAACSAVQLRIVFLLAGRTRNPLLVKYTSLFSALSPPQVGRGASQALAERFDASGRKVLVHASGHLLPSAKTHAANMRVFLQDMQRRAECAGSAGGR